MATPSPSSRAAELAAEQVEAIVNAAEQAAEEIRAAAERDARERERDAEREADRLRTEAHEAGDKERAAAEEEAARILEIARREADKRVVRAREAADESLASAEAISTGLRRLAESLEGQAERILRDVQAGHRRLMSDLRLEPSPAESSVREPRDARDRELLSAVRAGESKRRPGASPGEASEGGRGNPFDELEVPRWGD
jgi:hypothetical protein